MGWRERYERVIEKKMATYEAQGYKSPKENNQPRWKPEELTMLLRRHAIGSLSLPRIRYPKTERNSWMMKRTTPFYMKFLITQNQS